MAVSWQLFRRILASAALLGVLLAHPAWARHHQASRARVTAHHVTPPAHDRHVRTRHLAHTTVPRHAATRPRRAVARRGKPTARHLAQALAHRPLIVIDPGHGGADSGAVGISGTLEKNVTLAAAMELRRLLEATGHYQVAMTRTRDVFVSLAARVAFAQSHHAALFIAIHANASKDSRAHGASVYVRSGQDDGARIAHLGADAASSSGIADALAGPMPQPRPGSAWLQYTLIDNLDDDIRMDADPARQAHFYVLGMRGIPSALLEIGFLSNRHDEALLKQAKYRRVVAAAIRDAIGDYFAKLQHPDAVQT